MEYIVIQSCTEWYSVVQSCTELYIVVQSCSGTELYGFVVQYRVVRSGT